MANLVDKSGDAYSNVVHGDGSNSLTFTMPGNVSLGVESVVSTVDNSAGGDTTATLTVRDASGEVIAKKRQASPIPGFDTGSATWALRIADDEGVIRFDVPNEGGTLSIETAGQTSLTADTYLQVFSHLDETLVAGRAMVVKSLSFSFPLLVTCAAGVVIESGVVDNQVVLQTGGGVNGVATDIPVVEANGGGAGRPSTVVLRCYDGKNVEVQQGDGTPLFRVDHDGKLHGKTGQSLVFDL